MPTLFGAQLTRSQIEAMTGNLDQLGGVTQYQLAEGRARGLQALRIATGPLAVVSLAGRALDLAHASYEGIPLCWRSRDGDAAPTFYEPESNSFLRSFFGGLMTTCGLTNFGPGGEDQDGSFPLHGRIDHEPAENVCWSEEWEGDECLLEISGTVRQTRVFGENLTLRRRIRARLGAKTLEVWDRVTNEDASPVPHMILYHCNGGFPILQDGAVLYVSHRAMRPRDARAAEGLTCWSQAAPPVPGFREEVFIHTPVALADGRAAVALVNRRLRDGEGVALCIRFAPEELPALFTWRMMGYGTYVMGMEPANCPTIEGRIAAREQGTLPFLQPHETREYHLEFEVLIGEEIDEVVSGIEGVNARYESETVPGGAA